MEEIVLWHATTFNDSWIQDVHSGNTRLWIELRHNAAEKARTALRKIAAQSEQEGIAPIISALKESADTLRNYRGSWCGAEICLRLAIQIWVLVKAVQDIEGEDASNTLRHIAAMYTCPEITRFAGGEIVR
jgi:hypothetical protein